MQCCRHRDEYKYTLVTHHAIRYSLLMEISDALLQKVAAYTPNTRTIATIKDVPILVVVGISGAGKDTVVGQLAQQYSQDFQFMVSHTTRALRSNNGVMEQNGHEYHFISMAEAERMLDAGEYIEAQVYAHNIYGTSFAEVLRAKQAGKTIINDIEVRGVGAYVALGMNVKPVFLLPPSFEVWWQRLIARYKGSVDARDVRRRIETALDELRYARANDFFYLLVNDDLQTTVDALHDMATNHTIASRSTEALRVIDELIGAINQKLPTL